MVLATPPRPDGSVTPEVLYCAKKAGVSHILKAGGAQAVAAMAWGTQTCPKVDKIFGPGNQYVTAAKMLLTNSEAMISIDMPAGPSEVLVIAGEVGQERQGAALGEHPKRFSLNGAAVVHGCDCKPSCSIWPMLSVDG